MASSQARAQMFCEWCWQKHSLWRSVKIMASGKFPSLLRLFAPNLRLTDSTIWDSKSGCMLRRNSKNGAKHRRSEATRGVREEIPGNACVLQLAGRVRDAAK